MNSLKKILLLLVAVTSFGLASYNLVWSPDWQAKRWPESQLRAPYVASMARALVDFSGTEKEVLIQRHLQNYDAEIETKIFNSVLISVGLSLLLTAATALLWFALRPNPFGNRRRPSQDRAPGQPCPDFSLGPCPRPNRPSAGPVQRRNRPAPAP